VTVPLHGGPAAALEAIEAEHLDASEIQVRTPTLDDVYIQLTGARFGDSPGRESNGARLGDSPGRERNGTRLGEGDPTQN
jgi:hypothetical protein